MILIVYYSRLGSTKKISEWIREGLGIENCEVRSVDEIYSLDYDTILIGSPIYFGRIPKKLRRFLVEKKDLLAEKRVIPFIVCIRDGEKYLANLRSYLENPEDGKIFGGKFLFINKLNKQNCLEFGKSILQPRS
ncbi:MAG: flavodoxin domain-containing protein [Candidatus Thermoplasmatota archaeon]